MLTALEAALHRPKKVIRRLQATDSRRVGGYDLDRSCTLDAPLLSKLLLRLQQGSLEGIGPVA